MKRRPTLTVYAKSLDTNPRAPIERIPPVDDEFLNADEEDFETDDYDERDEDDEEGVLQDADDDGEEAEAEPEEVEEEAPPADHVVHVYEYGKFKRTIEREFTAEDAEAFASDFNRTAKPYSRFALAAKAKARPKKTVPWPVYKGASK
jgi:hypothetical protein